MESKESKLDLQCKQFSIVIGARHANGFVDIDNGINSIVASYGGKYAYAYHDRDTTYLHYHLVLVFEKRIRLGTILNRLSVAFGCSKDNISVTPARNLNASIQYLVHKNQSDKEQYPDFIINSNFSKDALLTLLNTKDYEIVLTIDMLLDICAECSTLVEVMQKIGLANYTRYRNVIIDILKTL